MKRLQEVKSNIEQVNQQIQGLVERRENLVHEYVDLVKEEGKEREELVKASQKIKELENTYWEIDKKQTEKPLSFHDVNTEKKKIVMEIDEQYKLVKKYLGLSEQDRLPLDWDDFIPTEEYKSTNI